MNIDERLEFLRQSTESLHGTCQELHAIVAQQADEMKEFRLEQQRLANRERQGRQALLAGIRAYLEGLEENGEQNGDET